MVKKPLLIAVCGATATGKTDLAFELAKQLDTEIISFDSVQVYRYFNIGTAKPPPEMLSQIPHHFVDAIEPTQLFTAGDFRRETLNLIENLKHKFKVFVLVGGTGFYLQALLKGMFDVPEVSADSKLKLETELNSQGLEALFAEVQSRDPAYAAKIHANDRYRILRALELMRAGTKTVTEIQSAFAVQSLPFEIVQVGLRREKPALLNSVNARTAKMLKDGLVEETIALSQKFGAVDERAAVRALESVGYKDVTDYLKGKITREHLAEEITKSTMALAKRQNTWFKRDASIRWFDPDVASLKNIAMQTLQALNERTE